METPNGKRARQADQCVVCTETVLDCTCTRCSACEDLCGAVERRDPADRRTRHLIMYECSECATLYCGSCSMQHMAVYAPAREALCVDCAN